MVTIKNMYHHLKWLLTCSIVMAFIPLSGNTPNHYSPEKNQPISSIPVLLTSLDTSYYEDTQLNLSDDIVLDAVYDPDFPDSLLNISIISDSGTVFYWYDRDSRTHKFWSNKDVDSCGYFHIQVSNPRDSILTKPFIVDIVPVNDAPVINSIPDTMANQDSSFALSLSRYCSDVDNRFSDLSWSANASICSVNFPFNNDSLICRPPSGFTGWDTLVIRVSDPAGLADMDTFRIYFRDIYPPSFTVGIFQNPVASEHLDIYFFPEEVIDSVYATLINGDSVVAEFLSILDPAPYHAHFRLHQNGTQTLRITAADTSGNIGTTNYDFSSSLISKKNGGCLYSPDLRAKIEFPGDCTTRDYHCLCLPRSHTDGNNPTNTNLVLSKTGSNPENYDYVFTAPDINLNRECKITFFPKDANRRYAICEENEGKWTLLETFTNSRQSQYWIYTKKLGAFTLKSASEEMIKTVPDRFRVSQNYPNPFNAQTLISVSVPDSPNGNIPSGIDIIIVNIRGQEVDRINRVIPAPGHYQIPWNGHGQPSGVYFYSVHSGNFRKTMKMVLVK